MESSSSIESMLMDGRECSKQLIAILKQQSSCNIHKSTAKDLLVKIMEVLDVTISTLSTSSKSTSSSIKSEIQSGESRSFLESKSEDSIFTISPSSVDRRECKKTRTLERFVKETTTLVDDGHVWRKYGQKNIRDSSHPRDYFRCTNKFDQGCEATKHVQKVQNNPPKYRTIYFGQHTCKNLSTQPQNMLCCDQNTSQDVYDDRSSSVLLSFGSTTSTTSTKDGHISTFFPSVESEHIIDTEERYRNRLPDEVSPRSGYLSPLDMTVVSDELDMPIMSMLLSSDFYEDMIMAHSGNLDVEMMNMAPLNYFDDGF